MRGFRERPWIVVGLVWTALAGVAAVWVALDRRPPEWDYANHLERAILCAHDLAEKDVGPIMERSSFYPPLVPCAAGLVYLLWSSDAAAGQVTIVALLGLAMAALYLLGGGLAGNQAGVVAAVLFGTAPLVVFSLLRFQLDLPLAAAVATALLVLTRSAHFARLGWSIASGLVLGAGMLIKLPFAGYVLPALVGTLAGVRTRPAFTRATLALATATLVALPWYGPRAVGFPRLLVAQGFKRPIAEGAPDVLTAAGLAFYPKWFLTEFGLVAGLLVGVGAFVAWRRREWTLLVSVGVPFALVELIRNKDVRYLLPLLPAAALVAALGWAALGTRTRRLGLVTLAIAAVLQILGTAFGTPPAFTIPWAGTPWVMASPPLRAHWPHRQILSAIVRDSGGAAATVSVVPNTEFLSASNIRYYAARDGLWLRVTRAWSHEPIGIQYMILKTGDQGPSWTAERPRRIGQRLATDAALAAVFPVIEEFPLPDGSTAIVRGRRLIPLDVDARTMAGAVEAALRRRVSDIARGVEGLKIVLGYDDAIRSGRVNRLELAAREAVVGDWTHVGTGRLRFYDVHVVLTDVLVNPVSAVSEKRLDPLAVGRLRIERATVTAPDLQAFLAARNALGPSRLTLGDGTIELGLLPSVPGVAARVRLFPDRKRIIAVEAEVRVGAVAIPAWVANWVFRHYDPFPRLAKRALVPVEVGAISVTPERIRIANDQ